MMFVLSSAAVRARALNAVHTAPDGYVVTIKEPARSLDQNAAMWPILDAFSRQLKWPVNGAMVHMSDDEWKDVLTAGFERAAVRVAMGLDGGVVMLGRRTSTMGKRRFSEFLDFVNATAADRGVNTDPQA